MVDLISVKNRKFNRSFAGEPVRFLDVLFFLILTEAVNDSNLLFLKRMQICCEKKSVKMKLNDRCHICEFISLKSPVSWKHWQESLSDFAHATFNFSIYTFLFCCQEFHWEKKLKKSTCRKWYFKRTIPDTSCEVSFQCKIVASSRRRANHIQHEHEPLICTSFIHYQLEE